MKSTKVLCPWKTIGALTLPAALLLVLALSLLGVSPAFAQTQQGNVTWKDPSAATASVIGSWSYDDESKTLSIETDAGTSLYGNAAKSLAFSGLEKEMSQSAVYVSVSGVGKISQGWLDGNPDSTLAGFPALRKVTFSEGLTEVGAGSFYDAKSVSVVRLPDGVKKIGESAFSGCTSLLEFAIPSTVTEIGVEAFCNCAELPGVGIPAGVKTVRNNTFYGCSSLRAVSLPSSVSSIGNAAFRKCRSLRQIVLPEGVTTVNSNTFYGCTGLKSVTLPSTLTKIGEAAFCNCASLASVTLPTKVTTIVDSAFSGCTKLESVNFNEGLVDIGAASFINCTALKSVTLPASVLHVRANAFRGCTSLMGLTVEGRLSTLADGAFVSLGMGSMITLKNADNFNRYYGDSLVYSPLRSEMSQDGVHAGPAPAEPIDLSNATLWIDKTPLKYTARAQKPDFLVIHNRLVLEPGVDFDISFSNNVHAGTATLTITGKGEYCGTKTGRFAIGKASQTLSVKVSSKTFYASKLKKKGTSFSLGASSKTKKSYRASSKMITVTSTGKVYLKRGIKKGTYKVTVTARSTSDYYGASKTVTVRVK